ncbi:hypothetical protein BsWGS_03937 [Bradybaena similaris]
MGCQGGEEQGRGLGILKVEGDDNGDDDLEWWKKVIIYQIYPRSYKDTNGDGVGDLKGITSKLDYLADLGIGCIWISPVYPSPMNDFGYDLTDYEDIESLFGSLADFDELVAEVHKRGLKIIIDFVPSYTSSEHRWFRKSVRREGKYTDYYIWHDGILLANGTRAPPSNWLAVFGWSAWAWHPVRQQFYYHSFFVKQPNLNHRDRNVEWEMKSIIRFWLDRGVDGFRVDAIQQLFVAANYTLDEPLSGGPSLPYEYDYTKHIYISDQPETVQAVTAYYSVLDEYFHKDGKVRYMVIETYADPSIRNTLYATGGVPFNFGLVRLAPPLTGRKLADRIQEEYQNLPKGAWPNFVLGNHDNRRVSYKFGPQNVDALNLVLLTLWGTPTTYEGEELGMTESNISYNQTRDPFGINFGPDRYQEVSRDPARTPMQWDDGDQAGFTSGNQTWLPLADDYKVRNVKTEQESATLTSLQFYKQLARLRARPAFISGKFTVAHVDDNIFSYLRELADDRYLVAVNVGGQESTTDFAAFSSDADAQVLATTPALKGISANTTASLSAVKLKPGDGVLFKVPAGTIVG